MDELNDFGVFLGDIYVLNYYGILVFFYVCKTTERTVFLVELETKPYKNGLILTETLKASKKPLIIVNNNTYTKTTYEVMPTKELFLPIQITTDLPIYEKALECTDYPLTGVFYISKVVNHVGKYWVCNSSEKIDRIKNLA